MNETFLHAGLLGFFVALCVAAGSEGARDNATRMAAQRAVTIAAQQAVRSQPPVRLAQEQIDAASRRAQ